MFVHTRSKTGVAYGISTAMVVVISASATAHFSVNTVVAWPRTISANLSGYSSVTCTQSQNVSDTAQISYATDSVNGDMIMMVEF